MLIKDMEESLKCWSKTKKKTLKKPPKTPSFSEISTPVIGPVKKQELSKQELNWMLFISTNND